MYHQYLWTTIIKRFVESFLADIIEQMTDENEIRFETIVSLLDWKISRFLSQSFYNIA